MVESFVFSSSKSRVFRVHLGLCIPQNYLLIFFLSVPTFNFTFCHRPVLLLTAAERSTTADIVSFQAIHSVYETWTDTMQTTPLLQSVLYRNTDIDAIWKTNNAKFFIQRYRAKPRHETHRNVSGTKKYCLSTTVSFHSVPYSESRI